MLLPHTAPVSAVAIGLTGHIWSVGYDGVLGCWGVADDRLVPQDAWVISPKNVNCVAAAEDGRVAAGDSAGIVTVLDGHQLRQHAHPGDVESLAWAEDGRLASGGTDGRVRVWGHQGELVAVLEHGGTVGAMAFHGADLVTVCNDGVLRRYNREHDLVAVVAASGLPLKSVAATGDGLLIGGHDTTLRLLRGEALDTIDTMSTTPKALASDGESVALACYDGTLRAGTDPAHLRTVSKDPRIWAHGVAIHGDLLAVGSFDGAPMVFRASGPGWCPLTPPPSPVPCISSLDSGSGLVTGGDSGVVYFDGKPIASTGEAITAVRISNHGIVAATWSGTLHVGLGGPGARAIDVATCPIVCCEVLGDQAYAGLYSGGMIAVDLGSGRTLWRCSDATGAVKSVHAHGDLVAMTGRYDDVRLLERATGAVIGTVPIDTTVSDIIRFCPTGRRIAYAAGSHEVRVYGTSPLAPEHVGTGHQCPIKAMAWLDGERIATGDYAGVVMLHHISQPSTELAQLSPRLGVSALALHHGHLVATTFDGHVDHLKVPLR